MRKITTQSCCGKPSIKQKSDSNARFQSCASQHRNVELQLNYLISVGLVRLLANQLHQRRSFHL